MSGRTGDAAHAACVTAALVFLAVAIVRVKGRQYEECLALDHSPAWCGAEVVGAVGRSRSLRGE